MTEYSDAELMTLFKTAWKGVSHQFCKGEATSHPYESPKSILEFTLRMRVPTRLVNISIVKLIKLVRT